MKIRPANTEDLPFIVRTELVDEGTTPGYRDEWTENEFAEHRELMLSFVVSPDKGARVVEEGTELIGMILWRYRNRFTEDIPASSVFCQIDSSTYSLDGAFCEIFNLWVDPRFRRRGLGTELKISAEEDAVARGVKLVYTHTEETNPHVLELNKKLGYVEVRRGPIWDEVVRVSLVKTL